MEAKTRVLIVDDERGMCDFLQYFLAGEGYTVDQASSSSEALQKMTHAPYDIVFTDIRMPGMDGLEMLKRIKQHAPDVAVVVMTAYPSSEYELKAVNYGADQYVAKPLDNLDAILDVMRGVAKPSLRPTQPDHSNRGVGCE
jgi:CheY-like chemotaxis protein